MDERPAVGLRPARVLVGLGALRGCRTSTAIDPDALAVATTQDLRHFAKHALGGDPLAQHFARIALEQARARRARARRARTLAARARAARVGTRLAGITSADIRARAEPARAVSRARGTGAARAARGAGFVTAFAAGYRETKQSDSEEAEYRRAHGISLHQSTFRSRWQTTLGDTLAHAR